MRFLIFIYGEKYGKRFLLSEDANQKCRIILTKDEFSIEQTMFLELEYIMQEWYIKETAYYKVSKKQFFQTEKVEENQAAFYKLNTGRKYILKIGEKNISIQCIYCKYDWSTYRTYRLKVCRIIKQSNKVFLTGDDSEQIPCVNILNKNGQWFLNNYGIEPVYINGDFIKENKKLSYGDIIYFFGRIFLFFDDFIAVEQTEEEMNVFCLEEIKVNEFIQDKGIIAPMLKESFHRAPRIMEHLEKLTLQIENPPILGMFGMEEQRSVFMDIGAVLSMMFPMLGMNVFLIYGMRTEGNQAGTYVYSGIFMVVMSVMCSLLWIMISRQYEKRQRKERADRKKNAYRRYLNKKSMQIKEQYEKTYKVLQSRYLCADRYVDNSLLFLYLWNRNPYHEDFLKYRVGTGNMRFPMEIKFVGEVSYEEEGILWQEAEKIREHYNIMHQIPMLLDITQYNQVGVIEAEMDDGMLIVRNLILQIVLCNCYTEVKLACIYDKNKVMQYEQWGFCRWLPHIWDSDRRKRNIAENLSEARELFYRLLQVFKERERISTPGRSEQGLPHYILFIAEEKYLDGEMFSKYIFNKKENYGLTVIWLVERREQLPNTCKLVLERSKEFSGWYEIERHSQKREEIHFDYIKKEAAERLIRTISGIRVAEIEEKRDIPDTIDFLKMYGVMTVKELDIESRWRQNSIYESCRVLIGKKAGGESCYLDIHERYHGPHGLLAGTTGSGKSEVLQTFILSMAVNFSPEAVCFLLIDYKGEGMSALFSELPHISGKISNLSDGQAYRAMVSIKSENKRRQRIFKECKVNNINDYTRLFNSGSVNEPIPHLLIIIDEFAELKKAEPEFMQELISVAQVGRSLGVHLLLATQKPGGVVDDKIWSNSRFRICLKVQEREDSMDMLHNMDACQITQTGRGYLQVGNNEVYELFQAGWSGALFQQEDTEVAACLVQTDGTIYKRRKNAEKNREKKITQLQAIKQYIIRFAKEKEYQEGRKLWLEPLAKYIYLDEIHKEMNKDKKLKDKKLKEKRQRVDMNKNLEVCVGIFDDPENQEQSIFSLNLMESGHIAICGRSASGKSTFFQTFLFSLLKESTAEEVCLYLLDFNGSGMDIYDLMPQVKQVIKEEEEDKVEELFENIKKEMKRRKKKFSGGNFKQYKNKSKRIENKSNEDKRDVGKEDNVSLNQIENKKEEFPLILIIVDGFVEFCEETYQRYDDSLYLILREGEKLGIKVMISIESFSGMYISMRIAELFKTKICLYMKDKYAYTEVFDVIQISVFPKAEIPGRGIAYYGERILEFQTALALNVHNDYERREKIKEVLNRGVADGIC